MFFPAAPVRSHFSGMPDHVSHAPTAAFLSPCDIATPLSRTDFWLFYLGHVVISLAAAWLLSRLDAALGPGPVATAIRLAGLLSLLYLVWILVAAICRRLADSGFRRAALPVAALLWIAFLALFAQDAARAFEAGIRTASAVDYGELTYAALAAAFLATGYIAIGTMRPGA